MVYFFTIIYTLIFFLALVFTAPDGAAQGPPEHIRGPDPDEIRAENYKGGLDPDVDPMEELPAEEVPEYRPPVPEVPMTSLSADELPEPKGPPLSATGPGRRFLPFSRPAPPDSPTHFQAPPEREPSPILSKLPPGYTVASPHCAADEEEVKNGAALLGVEPIEVPWGDRMVQWTPKICRKKGGVK